MKALFKGSSEDLLVATGFNKYSELAEAMGITRQYLSNILGGNNHLTGLRIKKLEKLIKDESYDLRENLHEIE